MTFSLAARCPRTGMLGVAVTTSSIAVGSRCAFARAQIGAVLSQREGSLIEAALTSAKLLGDSVARAVHVGDLLAAGARVMTATGADGKHVAVVARDPLGIRPLCYAKEGALFAAASESVALLNLGFAAESIKSMLPGQAAVITMPCTSWAGP